LTPALLRNQIPSGEEAAAAILLYEDQLAETSSKQFEHQEDQMVVAEEDLALRSVATERLDFLFVFALYRL
jgi:RecG-like helicase